MQAVRGDATEPGAGADVDGNLQQRGRRGHARRRPAQRHHSQSSLYTTRGIYHESHKRMFVSFNQTCVKSDSCICEFIINRT